jgi:hypothetical protein
MPRAGLYVLTVLTTLLLAACQQSGPTARPAQATPSASLPAGLGVVVGQISPCYGMDLRGLPTQPPAHPAGTVVVLRGTVTWVPTGAGGVTLHLPTETVTSESIPGGGQYRFILPPGPYVIFVPSPGVYVATPGGQMTAVGPYTIVSVVAGQTINTQDVPREPCR